MDDRFCRKFLFRNFFLFFSFFTLLLFYCLSAANVYIMVKICAWQLNWTKMVFGRGIAVLQAGSKRPTHPHPIFHVVFCNRNWKYHIYFTVTNPIALRIQFKNTKFRKNNISQRSRPAIGCLLAFKNST